MVRTLKYDGLCTMLHPSSASAVGGAAGGEGGHTTWPALLSFAEQKRLPASPSSKQ